MRIKLLTISDIKEFVSAANRARGNVTIVQDRYVINAKSILGIMSLDLTKTLNIVVDDVADMVLFRCFQVVNE